MEGRHSLDLFNLKNLMERKQELERMIIAGEIKTLPDLLEITNCNFKNLHDRLGITKYKLTQLEKDHVLHGTLDLAIAIAKMVGLKPKFLIEHFRFGIANITYLDGENLDLENAIQPNSIR